MRTEGKTRKKFCPYSPLFHHRASATLLLRARRDFVVQWIVILMWISRDVEDARVFVVLMRWLWSGIVIT